MNHRTFHEDNHFPNFSHHQYPKNCSALFNFNIIFQLEIPYSKNLTKEDRFIDDLLCQFFLIQIGKALKLSLLFPPVHTVRATFTAYGVPTSPIYSFLCIKQTSAFLPNVRLFHFDILIVKNLLFLFAYD
jgi:hypothetical protein